MWIFEDNKIYYINDDIKYYLNSEEIFEAMNGSYRIGDLIVPSPEKQLPIRFSRLGVNKTYIELIFADQKVFVKVIAEYKNSKYIVESYNNKILNYIVADNVWHYIGGNITIINTILNDLNINISENISFYQYMLLIKRLELENVDYCDNVSANIKDLDNNNDIGIRYLNAKLFDYQKDGFKWLTFMYENKCGCILADEMGLGKTLQIIALLGFLKENKNDQHFLIVAPMSLLENWKREIDKFYPNLKTLIHYGVGRTGFYKKLLEYDVIIMSYTSLKQDLLMLNMINWDLVVLDEAQSIKTPYAERTKQVKKLNRKMSIAVTGTPFENHMTDIWSIVDFVLPNYLGTLSDFQNTFTDDISSANMLESIITPIMIRRLVKDVAKDLPDRMDIAQPILMTKDEALLYERERTNNLEESLKQCSLDKIQSLRMFCTHPLVYDKNLVDCDPTLISNKYSRLCEIIQEIVYNKEKVIIFTSFNKMIEILVNDLNRRFNIPTLHLSGDIPREERQPIIDKFSKYQGSAALICNPKVAGAGLNITAANHVIHYNLEWNPAVEDQASARAYRRGQEKKVFVYRLFYANTLEEIINQKIQKKRELSETAIIGNNGTDSDREELIRALGMSPIKRGEYNE